jgi:hypothetical protein
LVRREAALPKTQRAERVPITLIQPYAAHPHARTVTCPSVRLLGEGNRHTDRLGVLQARDFPATAIHSPLIGGSSSDDVVDTIVTGILKRLYMSVTTSVVEFVVKQSLAELRRDQRIFSGAARLIAEIQKEKPNADWVFEHYSQLPESEGREFFFRIVESLRHRGSSLVTAACRRAEVPLCHLLDRFPARLQPAKQGPVELPPLDTRFTGRGIRSILYFFLRLEYLRIERFGLGVCPRCNDVFAKERRGAVYCQELCSKRHRSLGYYREHGRVRRREEAAASRLFSTFGPSSSKRSKR